MLYVLAIFLPPLAIFFTGRIFTAIVAFVIWIPSVILTFGGAHVLFILLAWIIIYQKGEDRRVNRLIRQSRDE